MRGKMKCLEPINYTNYGAGDVDYNSVDSCVRRSGTVARAAAKQQLHAMVSSAKRLDIFIDAYTPAVAAIARGALARLRRLMPGAVELVGDRYTGLVIGFSPTERPADATIGIVLYPRWVTLFFLRGAALRDPRRILQGSGSVVRHLRLHDPAVLDERDVQDLVAQARAQARSAFPRRRRTVIKAVSAKRRARRPVDVK